MKPSPPAEFHGREKPGRVAEERNEVIMEERLYDLIFIARPATPEEEIKKILSAIEHACAEKGGKIEKTEHWGTRKLAYRVAKHREGMYVYQQIRTSHGELIAELERRLRVQDAVIKYLTVRLDEDLKRQKKLSERREKRAARLPRPAEPLDEGEVPESQERVKTCRKNRNRLRLLKLERRAKARKEARAAKAPDREAAVNPVRAERPALPSAASASISARRKSASFASREWTSSTTSARTSFRSLCRSAERFCRAA